jgi:hypothetical protein
MINFTFSRVKYLSPLPLLMGLLSFNGSAPLPAGINGDFIGDHNQQSSICAHPIQFSLSNSDSTTSDLLVIKFLGNGGKADGIEITGVDGGSVSKTSRNEVGLRLASGEYATINLKAHFTNVEQRVIGYINGANADAVNVSFGSQAQTACK